MAEEFEIVKNANPTLVKDAQAEVGVAFDGGESFRGRESIITKKPNAKLVQREKIEEYDPEIDNVAQPDTNPLDPAIATKNNKARENIIPLLNPMSKTDGIRLDSILKSIEQDVAIEKAKPEPDPNLLDSYDKQKTLVDTKKKEGIKGLDGIVFPPREEGVNSAIINL